MGYEDDIVKKKNENDQKEYLNSLFRKKNEMQKYLDDLV